MTVIGNLIILGNGGIPISLTVSVSTGATVTATKGTKTITGVSTSNSCILSLPESGTWTISATLNGQNSGTRTVTVNDSYSTTLSFVNSTLNSNSWSVISTISNLGSANNYWAIGDCKAVTLNGTVGALTFSNENYYAFIIGFDHNSTYEGSNRIHFQFGKTARTNGIDICFTDDNYGSTGSTTGFRMNTSGTSTAGSAGGWSSSYMRNTICGISLSSYSGTFIGVLPSDLRSVLKTVTKYTDNTGSKSTASTNVTATTDIIFLLAEYELCGTSDYANTYEKNKQAQYAYYSAGNSRSKYRHTNTTSNTTYWTRSQVRTTAGNFVQIPNNGSASSAAANYSRGFAPGFCV